MNQEKQVYISSVGFTNVGEHWNESIAQLAMSAITDVLDGTSINQFDHIFVGNMMSSVISQQHNVGSFIADYCGFNGVPVVTIESAGSSGATAFRQAVLSILSGQINTALVLGIEKMTDSIGSSIYDVMSVGSDNDWELFHGVTLSGIAGLIMRRYMYQHNISNELFANFSINAHNNGANNSNAMFRNKINLERYLQANIVASPMNILDCAPDADGACAIVLTNECIEFSPGNHIRVAASNMSNSVLPLHDRSDILIFDAAHNSANMAYHEAGINAAQVDVAEIYDQFSIYAAMSLEACGFVQEGNGVDLANQGGIDINGVIPISTFGGLKSRGNPGGATGVYQIAEIALQLAGLAGVNQVRDPQWALAQCLGSSGGTAVTHILEKINIK